MDCEGESIGHWKICNSQVNLNLKHFTKKFVFSLLLRSAILQFSLDLYLQACSEGTRTHRQEQCESKAVGSVPYMMAGTTMSIP